MKKCSEIRLAGLDRPQLRGLVRCPPRKTGVTSKKAFQHFQKRFFLLQDGCAIEAAKQGLEHRFRPGVGDFGLAQKARALGTMLFEHVRMDRYRVIKPPGFYAWLC